MLTSRSTGEEDVFDAIKVAALCLGSFFWALESVAHLNQTLLFVLCGSCLPCLGTCSPELRCFKNNTNNNVGMNLALAGAAQPCRASSALGGDSSSSGDE